MRLSFLLFFLFIFFITAAQPVSVHRMPAEWEKQEAVILTYSGDPDDPVTTEKVHRSTGARCTP
ncbi:MAG TPA: hypothetical protein PLL23_04835 [Chitinophagaceae bacterium]|nr:hypothetical protein [Chitinophagaceae bacterium]